MKLETYPSTVLRTPSVNVEEFDSSLKEFVGEMEKVLKKVSGLGLAAPQLGVNKKVILCALEGSGEDKSEKKLVVFVNPEMINLHPNLIHTVEGCLSVPAVKARLSCRSVQITVSAFDMDGIPFQGTYSGSNAVVIQHEMDHLEGITIIDRMNGLKKALAKKKVAKFLAKHVQGQ